MYIPVFILIYLLGMNLAGFLLCRWDKRRAGAGRQRISEACLLRVGRLGGSFGLLWGMGRFRHKTRHRRFQLLVPLQCALWAVVLIHTVSALTLDREIQYLEVAYTSPAVSPELDGYLVAFVTDTHAMSPDTLDAVAQRVGAYAPDLLLLGGDYRSSREDPADTMEILSRVKAPDGIYGVEGNHDRQRPLLAAMERWGITPLVNSGLSVCEGLYLAGVEDLWNGSPDIAAATADAPEDAFVLLLSHNPDLAMEQDTAAVDLMLSGHTHGGQVTPFGVFAPALVWSRHVSDYGQRFLSGWAQSRDGADVFVSNGTGSPSAVPRVFARPQVILLTLRHPGDYPLHASS